MEPAAGWPRERAGRSPVNSVQAEPTTPNARNCAYQSPDIRVPWMVEDRTHFGVLDNLAGIHHRHAIGELRMHGHVVRDNDQ